MVNYLLIIFLFVILLSLFSLGLFTFLSMINFFYFNLNRKKLILISLLFNFIFLSIFLLSNFIGNNFFMNLYRFLNYYLGILLYCFLISLLFWIIYYIITKFNIKKNIKHKYIGFFFIFLILLINIIAIYNFEKGVQIEEFTIYSDKINQEYNFVMVADIQYGSVSKQYMKDVFKLILKQNPQFIVFVGDLLDTNNYNDNDFNFLNEVDVPIYFVRGNHEFYHYPDRLLNIFNNISSMELLINEKTYYEELQIIGIDYSTENNNLRNNLNLIEHNNSKFSILLYHEPKEVDYAIEQNIDLILLAHTHGGQIFPITIIVDLIYKYSRGYHEVDNSIIYTTDGAGLYGPKMRLGSQNEIVLFNLKPKNP